MMDMDTILATACLVLVVISGVILYFTEDKVRFTYHDQKVVVTEKRGKKK